MLLASSDFAGVSGYATLLTGMRVPYRRTYTPTDRERKFWDDRRQQLRKAAGAAMTVKEALAAVRSPKWRWADPPATPPL